MSGKLEMDGTPTNEKLALNEQIVGINNTCNIVSESAGLVLRCHFYAFASIELILSHQTYR